MTGDRRPVPAGAGLRLLRRCVTKLPRGRGRIARALAGRWKTPIIDLVAPTNLGVHLVIDPASPFQLEIWLGAYQPHVISFLLRNVLPGSTVLCAGLHVGYIVAIARKLAGINGLILTEPDPVARSWASRNLRLSDPAELAPVVVLDAGLSSGNGVMLFHQSSVMGHSSFGTSHQSNETRQVRVQQGDEWLRSCGVTHLDVMVLDVEGWETEALRGLSGTIGTSPSLRALVELTPWALADAGSSPAELVDFWRERGFEVRWAAHYGHGDEYGVWGPLVQDPGVCLANDILCLGPRDRSERR